MLLRGVKYEISFEELLKDAENLSDVIVKPSINSSAGIGVKNISSISGIIFETNEPLANLLKSYHGNFIIEKRIINNENLKRLNPSSCNTLRVHTWRNRKKAQLSLCRHSYGLVMQVRLLIMRLLVVLLHLLVVMEFYRIVDAILINTIELRKLIPESLLKVIRLIILRISLKQPKEDTRIFRISILLDGILLLIIRTMW